MGCVVGSATDAREPVNARKQFITLMFHLFEHLLSPISTLNENGGESVPFPVYAILRVQFPIFDDQARKSIEFDAPEVKNM